MVHASPLVSQVKLDQLSINVKLKKKKNNKNIALSTWMES